MLSYDVVIIMSEEYEVDLITMVDEEGESHEFEILDEIDTDEGHFLALLPTENNSLIEADTYYIFEVIEEDGEEQIAEVESDELLDQLADIFEKRFDENFYSDDEE